MRAFIPLALSALSLFSSVSAYDPYYTSSLAARSIEDSDFAIYAREAEAEADAEAEAEAEAHAEAVAEMDELISHMLARRELLSRGTWLDKAKKYGGAIMTGLGAGFTAAGQQKTQQDMYGAGGMGGGSGMGGGYY